MTKTQAEQIYQLTHSTAWAYMNEVLQDKLDEKHMECEYCAPETLGNRQGYIQALRYVMNLGILTEGVLDSE